jgi:tRNA(Ile)-lysidine synthase
MIRKIKSGNSWQSRAVRLGESIPCTALHPATVAWAGRRPRGERWAVAFSGGADSLALLGLLWAHWPARRARLLALHFNHRLRGRASSGDAVFCRRVCAALGVELRLGRWEDRPERVTEEAARAARHEFFGRELKRARCRVLWLAHQQDDIAETMLMRLARGSGTAGLAAPRPVQQTGPERVHVRPLLTRKKAELITALRAAGASWREDASNTGQAFFRNRIRRDVLPALVTAAGRDAVAGAALARERLQEDDDALEAQLDKLAPLSAAGRLSLRRLCGQPRAVTRRALHRWLAAQPHGGDLSRQGFDLLLGAVERGTPTRFSVSRNGFAVIRDGWLQFARTR